MPPSPPQAPQSAEPLGALCVLCACGGARGFIADEEVVAIESGELAPARATIREVLEKSMGKTRTILYPQSILDPRTPDEMFREEAQAMTAAGHNMHLIDTEALTAGPARIRPPLEPGACVVYRGWMLTHGEYVNLAASVERAGGSCFTSPEQYVATHHLPNWYTVVKDYTPETVFLDAAADLVSELRRLGWERFFVKDHVKSLKTSVGSIVEDPKQIETVVSEMEKYRGFIEGGLCVRRVEDFIASSERRYFVLNRTPYAAEPETAIPDPVANCAKAIPSPFFSVDVARRADGVERIVEVGDGQVSDLVGWSVERFVEIWNEAGMPSSAQH
jgi:hypothetical protein